MDLWGRVVFVFSESGAILNFYWVFSARRCVRFGASLSPIDHRSKEHHNGYRVAEPKAAGNDRHTRNHACKCTECRPRRASVRERGRLSFDAVLLIVIAAGGECSAT